ncbi:MAG: DNA mismatch repair endonuclease MutH [Gammaproteobacteria bacterium]|nr:DNA mismatch repair endonuclease MutH [Gammaproteobacteria bacterium]
MIFPPSSIFPPANIDELIERSTALAGLTLGEIAEQNNLLMPPDLQRHKGWVGQLLEQLLGANAGSRAEPDFTHLGIELKTIPIDHRGLPRETTYVCTVPLLGEAGYCWEESWLYNKLKHVLWIPVEGEREIPLAARHIGMPLLWQPNREELELLRRDWEELMEMVRTGHVEEINARIGEVLQIRPKAANGRVLSEAIGETGERIMTNPQGFYLRKRFTREILGNNFIR